MFLSQWSKKENKGQELTAFNLLLYEIPSLKSHQEHAAADTALLQSTKEAAGF